MVSAVWLNKHIILTIINSNDSKKEIFKGMTENCVYILGEPGLSKHIVLATLKE
jgi:hypothetical protein